MKKISELVLNAIRNLRDRNGSTTKDITNFIMSEHKELSPTVKKQITSALQRAVDHGYLTRTRGHFFLSGAIFPNDEINSITERHRGKIETRSACGPKTMRSRKRRRSKSRAMCGPTKRRSKRGRSAKRKSRRHGRIRSKRGRRGRSRKGRSRSSCKPRRSRKVKRKRSKGMKCAPLSPKESRSYNPVDHVIKANTPVEIEEIYEQDVKPAVRRSTSRHPSRAGSKAPSRRGSRPTSHEGRRSRSSD